MSIKVVLAFSNSLFSEGIAGLMENEKDIEVSHILDAGSEYTPEKWRSISPDVVLTDLVTLYNSFPEAGTDKKLPFILFDTNCGKDNIVAAILNKKVSGVVPVNSDSEHLMKAIRTVARGDIWIDRTIVKNLVFGINAIEKENVSSLTDREKGVIELIGKGYRNKEIAQKLNISEPTVKTHLHRIFQKLNVRSRTELITYAIKHSAMSGGTA